MHCFVHDFFINECIMLSFEKMLQIRGNYNHLKIKVLSFK